MEENRAGEVLRNSMSNALMTVEGVESKSWRYAFSRSHLRRRSLPPLTLAGQPFRPQPSATHEDVEDLSHFIVFEVSAKRS